MRFGGHETFPIRDGWLYKGLALLLKNPSLFYSNEAADYLGVGGNMAKSIRHWMLATGLVEKAEKGNAEAQHTELAQLIHEYDPYFTSLGTWWALHINLVNNPDYAQTWNWLFNYSGQRRFEKGVAVEQFKRYLHHNTNLRSPAQRTLERDFAVLLGSYSRPIPFEPTDPEDSKECPFQDLNLLSYFRESGFYQINFSEKPIPSELFGFALSKGFLLPEESEKVVTVSVTEAAKVPNSPGKVFCLRAESIFDLASRAQSELSDDLVRITGLAGSRNISFQAHEPEIWLGIYYQRQEEEEERWLGEQKINLLKVA